MMTMITLEEAATLADRCQNTIRDYYKREYIRGSKDDGVLKICKEDLVAYLNSKESRGNHNPFGVAVPEENEAFKPLFSLEQGYITFSKNMTLIGSEGTIWNVTHGHIYEKIVPDTNGHIQIRIDGKLYYLHRLIAMTWCDNRKFKQIVHHINGNPTDNRSKNLLWVSYDEHMELHNLLDDDKRNEYNKLVKKIQRDNKWKGEKLYPLIDKETSDDNWLNVYMTNYRGYCMLLHGFEVEELASKKLLRIEYGCKNEGKKSGKDTFVVSEKV